MVIETAEKTPTDPVDRVGRYRIRAEIASGGMATVYLAHLVGPHGFEKAVAVKRIHPHLTKDRRFVEMFLDEARVAGSVQHPNVCAILDFGEERGAPYLVMEYLHGESFGSVVKTARTNGEFPLWLAARVIHDAARGLHAAHELTGQDGMPLGVVHRDVSPDNLFVLYDGLTKVVDFGVARARNRLTVTRTNEVKGKLPYMSPEQFGDERIDRRTDVWALGVVLWEATVGVRLFRADNDGATIARVLTREVPLPSSLVADYPPALEAIVMRCLQRVPGDRYATADALADDLETFLYSTGVPSGSNQLKRWMNQSFAKRIEERDAMLRGDVPLEQIPVDEASLSSVRDRIVAEEQPTRADAKKARPSLPPPAPVAPTPSVETRAVTARARPRVLDPDVVPLSHQSTERDVRVRSRGRLLVAFGLIGVVLGLGLVGVQRWFAASERPRESVVVAAAPVSSPAPISARLPEGAAPPAPSAPPIPAIAAPPVAAPAREVAVPTPRSTRNADTTDRNVARPIATPPATATSVAPTSRSPAPEPTERQAAAPAESSSGPGRLNLLAIPSATVRLGGRNLGETPLLGLELPAGTHRLDLATTDGQRQSVTVTITSGATTRRRVEF